MNPRALIADDEPMLRDELAALLARAWPELEIVAQARASSAANSSRNIGSSSAISARGFTP